jgi:hypothetical protein
MPVIRAWVRRDNAAIARDSVCPARPRKAAETERLKITGLENHRPGKSKAWKSRGILFLSFARATGRGRHEHAT